MNRNRKVLLHFYKISANLCNFVQEHIGLELKTWYTINRVKNYFYAVGGDISVTGYILK